MKEECMGVRERIRERMNYKGRKTKGKKKDNESKRKRKKNEAQK